MEQDFAITLKLNHKFKQWLPSDYLSIRTKWMKEFNGVNLHTYFFEKEGGCHLHGIITLPRNFYRKRLMQKGLHIHMIPLFAVEGWLEYCKKNQKKYAVVPRQSPKDGINIGLENNNSIPAEKIYVRSDELLTMLKVYGQLTKKYASVNSNDPSHPFFACEVPKE